MAETAAGADAALPHEQTPGETRVGEARADGRERRQRRRASGFRQQAWRPLVNPYRPIEVLTEEQLAKIEDASFRILENIGLEILHDGALDRLEKVGASVDRSNKRVRMDRAMVLEYVAKAPALFTLHARNPARSVTIGGNHVVFASVSSAPNVSDLDRGRRPGTRADFQNLLRIAQSLNVIHSISGYPVEPADLPPSVRHLDAQYDFITLTDRIWMPSGIGAGRVADALALDCIARGITEDEAVLRPGLHTVINTNSPLRVDQQMIDGLTFLAEHGQAVIVTPFTLSGAMAPATLAGALALQNAEALGVIAYMQMVKPGALAIYGCFTSNVDMKSGAPAFGTPEYTRAAMAGGQLARRYNLPYRSSNCCSANAVDAQAAYESCMSLWGAVMGGANMVKHGAGWMEGGLVASYEKMILDAEILQTMSESLQPFAVDDDALGLDAIREVGPGGHFFGAAHTLARYETAFYAPILSDWRNFETWREAGGLDAAQRANAIWKQILAEYEPPPIDPGIDEALRDYIARRKDEGGVGS
jgi:trimethylamine--corrinoid protein Co-methyltransferase